VLVLLLTTWQVADSGPWAPKTLRLLAGTELRRLFTEDEDGTPTKLAKELTRQTGITLQVTYTGSLAAAEQLAEGTSNYDLAWFATSAYLRAMRVETTHTTSIMTSPVVIGIKKSVLSRWHQRDPANLSWRDLAEKSFRFAMTHPSASNSGFAALVSAAAAFRAPASTSSDVRAVLPQLKRLFGGVELSADSSDDLRKPYATARSNPNLDGIVDYESELLDIKRGSAFDDIEILYPRDGVVLADYPLVALRLSADDSNAYRHLTNWLLTSWAQDWIVKNTGRRAADGRPHRGLPPLNKLLTVPDDKAKIDTILLAYNDHIRKPAQIVYVIDTSASMNLKHPIGSVNTRLNKVTDVLKTLVEAPNPQRFLKLDKRENATLMTFAESVSPGSDVVLTEDGNADASFMDWLDKLTARGQTNMYAGTLRAYRLVQERAKGFPYGSWEDYKSKTFPSIVLITDGEQNYGTTRGQFQQELGNMHVPLNDIRLFAIYVGPSAVTTDCAKADAPVAELCELARITKGKILTTGNRDLLEVFRDIHDQL